MRDATDTHYGTLAARVRLICMSGGPLSLAQMLNAYA